MTVDRSERLRAATELRPRRVGEIIDAAIAIFSIYFKPLIALAAMLLLPFQVVSAAVAVSVQPSLLDSLSQWQKDITVDPNATPDVTGKQIAAIVGSGLISFVGTFVLTAALTAFLIDVYLRREPDRGRSLRVAVRRAPVMLLSSILAVIVAELPLVPGLVLALTGNGIAAVVAVVIAIPFIFWLVVRLTAGGPSIVLEKAGPVRALRRSFRLTKGRFWVVLGITLLSTLITGIPAGIISSIVTGILSFAGGGNKAFEFVWSAIGGTVGAAVTAPASAAIAVILYIDLRIRREAFDLEQLAQSPGTPTTLG